MRRPQLEYAAPLWDPFLQKMLEGVQKLATCKWDQGYAQLMQMVDLPSLQHRQLHLKLQHKFRTIHGLCDFPLSFKRWQILVRGVQDHTCYISHLREQMHYFILYRVVQLHGMEPPHALSSKLNYCEQLTGF